MSLLRTLLSPPGPWNGTRVLTPAGSLLGSDVMAKLYAIAKRVYSTVDEKLNERACDVIEAGQ